MLLRKFTKNTIFFLFYDKALCYNRYYLFFPRSIARTLRVQLNELYTRLSQISVNVLEDMLIWS
jgi:hypothetical protein